MRGLVPLRVRMLVRPLGIVGGVGVGAGVAALVATYLPWYEVAATVEMLGNQRSRAVASLAGWQAHPWGWLVPALAIVAIVVAAALTVDRPVPATGTLALVAGLGLACAVAAAVLLFPPVSRFDHADSRLAELDRLADRLPQDVTMTFSVRPGLGLWIALAAAVALLGVAMAARELR